MTDTILNEIPEISGSTENASKRVPSEVPLESMGAPGRLNGEGPVAVVDIGSNSIRLVVYERNSRAPTVLYNEKVLVGLVRGIDKSGELSSQALEEALNSIQRFRFMMKHLGVDKTFVIATAAARDAKNGKNFVKRIEDICKTKVEILSGKQEAEYSALGVISGFQSPNGIAGDMGGGSLELVEIDGEKIGQGKTFGLGGIRLQEASSDSVEKGLKIARDVLNDTKWLGNGKDREFYAVGGTWRSLARMHMIKTKYPLHVMHGYTIPAKEAHEFCLSIATGKLEASEHIEVVSRNRRQLLPYGAAVMAAIIETVKPSSLVFSALGIREGLLYSSLKKDEQKKDPLLEAAWELGYLRSRSPEHMRELVEWTDHVYEELGIEETGEEKRLRAVACLLNDISWRAHPDYRGKQSLNIITNAGFVGLDHSARAFLGLSTYFHNHGLIEEELGHQVKTLVSEHQMERAKLLAAVLRLAHNISGSMPGVITSTRMKLTAFDGLQLILPEKLKVLEGERVSKRLKQLARVFGLQCKIVIGS